MEKQRVELVAELVRKAQSKDPIVRKTALGALYRETAGFGYKIAARRTDDRELVKDIVAEAFATLVDKIDGIREPYAYFSWFARLVNSASKRLGRQEQRYVAFDDLLVQTSDIDLLVDAPDVWEDAHAAALAAVLRELYDESTPAQRRLLRVIGEEVLLQDWVSWEDFQSKLAERMESTKREVARSASHSTDEERRKAAVNLLNQMFYRLRETLKRLRVDLRDMVMSRGIIRQGFRLFMENSAVVV